MAINLDKLVIDRVVDGWFENSSLELLAYLDQIQNFQITSSAETKDKTDAQGALIKRYYTAKSVEVTGENAVLSLNLMSIQTGSTIKTGSSVTLPRIIQVSATSSPYTLPETPIDGTLIVYGTSDNGVVDLNTKYTQGDAAADDTYAVTTVDDVTTITLPTNATSNVQIKYEYTVADGDGAARVDQDSSSFPKECKATFRVLCSDVCDPETVLALYIVFPRWQMSPDFNWTVDTVSAQSFTATAQKDYCGTEQLLFYVAVAEDSDEYDTVPFV